MKDQIVIEAALSQLGSPYVYGAWGGLCTPAYRQQYAGYNPSHADAIYRACPVLSDKATSCNGCKFEGKRAFDCRGFTHWCLEQAGIKISGGGATSQYNDAWNWTERGAIKDMPEVVCCVFQNKNGKMIHTGLHIGGGVVIHCSGEVKRGKITDGGWTHYAIPRGLYADDDEEKPMVLKYGSAGSDVIRLQKLLTTAGYDLGAIDGKFGGKTEAALKRYQADHGEDVTGIATEETLASLEKAVSERNVSIPLSLAKELYNALKERIQEG